MAKRSAPDEQPYRPLLDIGLMSAVMGETEPDFEEDRPAGPLPETGSKKIVEMTRPEVVRRPEPARPELEVLSKPSDTDRRPQAVQPLVEKFDQEKRILFTRAETQSIDRLVTSLAMRLNSQVKVSHVMRALVGLLLHAEGEIDKRAGEGGPLVRPPNGDAQALQRFEKEISKIIASAIRDAGPLR